MSFWNTFVGELIHRVSFGLIGPDGGPAVPPGQPSSNSGVMSETELKCIGDFDFFVKNPTLCANAHPPSLGPTAPLPDTGTSGGGSTVITNPPVSAVPEPSATVMLVAALVVIVLHRWVFKRSR